MGQRTTGWRTVLSLAPVYQATQDLLGGRRARDLIVERFVQPVAGQRILDIGCGTGSVLASLPPVEYVGLDLSEEYIDAARKRWGDQATFIRGDVTSAPDLRRGFDRVISFGVLHHLDDPGAKELLRTAAHALAPEGALITIDPARERGQHRVARWMIGRDRGEHVRSTADYAALAATAFAEVEHTTREDHLRVPYTHGIVTARVPRCTPGTL